MASTINDKELKELRQQLKETREHIKGNKKEAIKVLYEVGITNENGRLKPEYQVSK